MTDMANKKSKDEEYDWLEDPFDEEKQAADLEEARRAQRRSCLVVAIILIVIVLVAVILFGAYVLLSGDAFSNWV